MSLPVLCSLSLMLLLFSSILHIVAIILPAWIQFGLFVPVSLTTIGEEGRGGGEGGARGGREEESFFSNVTTAPVKERGGGEEEYFFSNITTAPVKERGGGGGEEESFFSNVTAAPVSMAENLEDYQGPMVFITIRLGLWEWCGQFRQMNPHCQEPGFVGGVEAVALLALFTLPLSFLLLACAACMDSHQHCPNKRPLLVRLSLLSAAFSGVLLLMAVTTYGVLAKREVSAMLLQIGEHKELRTFLGWAFGAEAVTVTLACLAAFCLVLYSLRQAPKAAPEFQPVA
ncbi:hypothetical protein ACOMHN_003395 [Nucella lapillus]